MPSYRFGNISTVKALIRNKNNGYIGESFIVDMHSRTGFSGSSVWVYRTQSSSLGLGYEQGMDYHFVRLLGIHWGQFPELWELKAGALRGHIAQANLVTDGRYVEGLSE